MNMTLKSAGVSNKALSCLLPACTKPWQLVGLEVSDLCSSCRAYVPLCFNILVPMMKHTDKSTLREKGFIWTRYSRVRSSITARKPTQDLEVAGHIVFPVRKQRVVN